MIRRSLVFIAFCGAFLSAPARAQSEQPASSAPQDTELRAAMDALDRGADQEALDHLKRILSEDFSHEAAFELWQRTEHRVWLRLLTQGGELEVVAKELMDRASMGRKQRQNNPDAIRELVKGLATDDVLARNRIVNQLASDYGEYAVPIMVYSLADQSDKDRRVNVMNALTRMGPDVVPPLIEALDAPDAFLRRNVASTLSYIKDDRARPALTALAANDTDTGVKLAAAQALQKLGGSGGDAGQLFLAQGDAYYREDDSVLLPFQYSDVVWRWEGNGLASTDVPRFLYAPEMAKKAYYRGLALLPDVGPALAGIARCAVTEIGRLDEWRAAGEDVGEWEARLQNDDLAAQLAGPEALDVALGWAIAQGDATAASGLCRLLAGAGKRATENLQRALASSRSGAVQGEAAVALGSIAFRNREPASPETVSALTRSASVEVVRIGAVIGADQAWSSKLQSSLGMHVNTWSTGGRGLAALKSTAGVDVIVINDRLPDITPNRVIDELRRDPRTAKTPIFVMASTPDVEEGAYGDKVTGVLSPDSDLSPVEAALSGTMNRDREEANLLATRAAETLYTLAVGGVTDVSSAADSLAGTLASRPDAVVIPALGVLEFTGGPGQVERITAVVENAERNVDVRVRAAKALAGIFSRASSADTAIVQRLRPVADKDPSFNVRAATASALGRLDLSRDVRVELMRGIIGR
jgi:CheY-like chemotaxis protein